MESLNILSFFWYTSPHLLQLHLSTAGCYCSIIQFLKNITPKQEVGNHL